MTAPPPTDMAHIPGKEQPIVAEPRYLVDESGNRTAVVLDLEEYRRLLDALEEIESCAHTTPRRRLMRSAFPSMSLSLKVNH